MRFIASIAVPLFGTFSLGSGNWRDFVVSFIVLDSVRYERKRVVVWIGWSEMGQSAVVLLWLTITNTIC